MSNSVKEMLFKNVSLMKALDTSLKFKETSVTYDGKKWHVGNVDIKATPEKLNSFTAFFVKLFHKIHTLTSPSYAQTFNRNLKLFERAFNYSEKSKVKALKAHIIMSQKANADRGLQVISAMQNYKETQEQLDLNHDEQEFLKREISQNKETLGSKLKKTLHLKNGELGAFQKRLDELVVEEKALKDKIKQFKQESFGQMAPHEDEQELANQLAAANQRLLELFPEEKVNEEAALSTEEIPFTFNEASLQLLDAIEKQGSPELRKIFEAMFTNISRKLGHNMIESFSLSPKGEGVVKFKESIHFWMPTTNKEGVVDSIEEPIGGAIFSYGNNDKRELQFSLSKDQLEVTKGWDVKARIPSQFEMFKRIAGEWPQAQIMKVSISEGQVSITGGKKVLGFVRKKETKRPQDKSFENWLNNGELVSVKEPKDLELFLAKKNV